MIKSCRIWAMASLLCPWALVAQTPEWIWHEPPTPSKEGSQVRFFRKAFSLSQLPAKAIVSLAADDQATLYLNGKQVLANRSWRQASTATITAALQMGANTFAVRASNRESQAGVILRLEITYPDGRKERIVSDPTWVAAAQAAEGWETPSFAAAPWVPATSRGQLGVEPWGDVMAARTATPADQLSVLPGFAVELVRSAEPGEGSWVCMATDRQGRLIISPQEGVGNLLRMTLTPEGQVEKIETIAQPVGGAMGLLEAFDSLYVSGNGPDGLGLYRLRDTDRDDRYDQLQLLRKFEGAGGEHGSHALVRGPDEKLYYVHGNFVKVPKDIAPTSPHQHYAEDQLLPRGEDGNGFGVGIKPPGGFVIRMDPDAKQCELFAAGLRNTYDIAFNADGELFGFDSDMEWDWGMPWYRPTRINHIVSGADFGFREGTGKMPIYYPDTLPTTVDIGIGSPTGVKFGTPSRFPRKYQKALYAMDWSYGRILAVHLEPTGSTYSGTFENFVAPSSLHSAGPKATLNVTDLEFGQDGTMFFLTGGRGTQSGLYRVRWTGADPATATGITGPAAASALPATSEAASAARLLRRQLEAFHGKRDRGAVDFAWPHLDSPDRWIRYAARIAVESQPVEEWQERALAEKRIPAALTALLALARLGPPTAQGELLTALDELPSDQYTEEQSLVALRVLSLSLIRMGRPDVELAGEISRRLDAHYPAKSAAVNRELAQLLIYLEAPEAAAKTLDLLASATTQEDQLFYLFHLRTLKTGWSLADRQRYFEWFDRDWKLGRRSPHVLAWFAEAGRAYDNGASFSKFLAYFRKDAVASLSARERDQLASFITRPALPLAPPAAPRTFVADWTTEDLLPLLDEVSRGRSFARGKETFTAAQCAACHRFGSDGGSVGPDLTAVNSRFARRDILESLLDPSKVVSEQYQNMVLFTKDGDDHTGRIVEETDEKFVVVTNPITQDKIELRKSQVREVRPSTISPMPTGLLNGFTKAEILDLLAYLESGGRDDRAAAAP